jgi:hypothetical protein
VSIGQWPYPEQVTFPPVDREQVTPSVGDVALFAATRTIDTSGDELGAFTSDTRPTDVQVNGLIAAAVTMVLTPLPDYFQESLYGRVKQAIVLQTAILIETSFYREQANAGSIVAMTAALAAMRVAIEADAGGAAVSQRVDTIVARSTIAEYDPYYVMPPPPVVGGGRAAAAQPVPPTGPPQVASISPPSWSISNLVNVIVSASGFNLQATTDLIAYLEDSSAATVASTSIVDPSGTGTMLTCTFPPPTAQIKLGAGWFYLRKAGAGYAAEIPWDWMA